jgi:hypothetical protein
MSSIKNLAFLFAAEGRLAEIEQRPADAAKSYLDAIRLGQESARGGVTIDLMMGVACENLGLSKLQRLAGELDAPSTHETIRGLSELETNRPPIEAVISREKQWLRKVATIRERIWTIWSAPFLDPMTIARMNATLRAERLLLLDLAARAYELELGRKPERAEQLVPNFLRSVPKDPESGTNLTLFTPSR